MSPEEEDKKLKARPKFQPIESKLHDDKLTIEYGKDDLEHLLPELTREIHENQDLRLSFNEVVEHLETEEIDGATVSEEEEAEKQQERELKNPDAISFIRRCSTVEQAQEIITYMESRGELTPELATQFRNQLTSFGLESFGPKKEPGYYERAFPRNIQVRKVNMRDL